MVRLCESGAIVIIGAALAGCAFSHQGRSADDVVSNDTHITGDAFAADDGITSPDEVVPDAVANDDVATDVIIVDVPMLDVGADVIDATAPDVIDVVMPVDVVVTTYRTDPAHVTSTSWNGTSSPGAQTQIRCNDTEVVTGILMNANDYVNSFGLHCATLQSDGTLTGERTIGRSGGSSGTDYDDHCPPGHVVTLGAGASASVVDSFGGACNTIDAWLAGTAADATLPTHGGTGGTAFTDACPTGGFVRGIDYDVWSYMSHDRVWRMKLECIPIVRTP